MLPEVIIAVVLQHWTTLASVVGERFLEFIRYRGAASRHQYQSSRDSAGKAALTVLGHVATLTLRLLIESFWQPVV